MGSMCFRTFGTMRLQTQEMVLFPSSVNSRRSLWQSHLQPCWISQSPLEYSTKATLVLDNAWMGDFLGTLGGAGMGSGVDAAYKQVDSVKSDPQLLVYVSGRASPSHAINTSG